MIFNKPCLFLIKITCRFPLPLPLPLLSIVTLLLCYHSINYYWRMIISCSKNNKMGTSILLAAFFPIKSSLFIYQSYVKLCFWKWWGNLIKKYVPYFLVAQYQLIMNNNYFFVVAQSILILNNLALYSILLIAINLSIIIVYKKVGTFPPQQLSTIVYFKHLASVAVDVDVHINVSINVALNV